MVKLRDARYCNLKLLLLYLVIYGHWIEPRIYDSEIILYQYKIIYLFHMPLFSFLSGLFIHNSNDCARRLKRILPVYIPLQVLLTAFGAADDLFTPCWILWYLLSLCLWLCFGWLWFRFGSKRRGFACLGLLFLTGALAGYIPWLDRTFSGSRTIVFLPYFFAGLLCDQNVQWQKHRRLGALALAGGLCLAGIFVRRVPASFLYQAEPFGAAENGFALRVACYVSGGLISFSLLTFAPGKRFPFTKAGADTMSAYLLHGPAVLLLRRWNYPRIACIMWPAILIYAIFKLRQWTGAVYGIIPLEGGNGGVRISGDI